MTAEQPVPTARTLSELLRTAAALAPDREALVTDVDRWTYAQLAAEAERAGRVLQARGIRPGDTVAILVPNIAEWVTVAFGAMSIGARVDAFNTWVKTYDLDHLLRASGAAMLVMSGRVRGRDLLAELRPLLPELWESAGPGVVSAAYPSLRSVMVIGDDVPPAAESWAAVGEPAAADPPDVSGQAQSPALVVYTSGSTSTPKAVPLCHRDLIVNGFHIGERMRLKSTDRVWFGSPLFWSFGCANALMAVLTHGACLVLQERFDPHEAVAVMEREQVTAAYLLPAMVDALARECSERMKSVESLRTGVMIGRAEEIRRAAIELGVEEICNIYGSTETYGNCCVTERGWSLDRRSHSQGAPLPGVTLRVVDTETGATLPAGESGELQVRGRVTPGYLNDEAANAAAFTADGWFRTGDRMVLDADGTIAFVGRISDMIKTSGINVSPAEVESFLSGHPGISEVMVVGAPHPTKDEVVVAFVVARGDDLTAQAVIDYSRERVAGYKVPWAVSLVRELPRTGTGKLVRKDLREPATALVNAVLSHAGPA